MECSKSVNPFGPTIFFPTNSIVVVDRCVQIVKWIYSGRHSKQHGGCWCFENIFESESHFCDGSKSIFLFRFIVFKQVRLFFQPCRGPFAACSRPTPNEQDIIRKTFPSTRNTTTGVMMSSKQNSFVPIWFRKQWKTRNFQVRFVKLDLFFLKLNCCFRCMWPIQGRYLGNPGGHDNYRRQVPQSSFS